VTDGTKTESRSLRAQQAELTRELILRALVERLEQDELAEITVPDIAAAAGVSLRTVYRYFPTREQLLEAGADWIGEILGRPAPRTVDELLEVAETTRHFKDHPRLFRALGATEAGREFRSVRRARWTEAIATVVREVTDNLPEDEQRRAAAVIGYINSLRGWLALHEEFGLESDETGIALEWAVRTLVDDLRRRNEAAGVASMTAGDRTDSRGSR
jgi:AcrR family transcriptional regulator